MLKSFLAVALVATATLLSASSAFAQVNYPQANASVGTPPSIAHQQAQASGQPDRCGEVAATALNNPSLRVQQYNGEGSRTSKGQQLQTAVSFANAGNYELCWHWYDRAQQIP